MALTLWTVSYISLQLLVVEESKVSQMLNQTAAMSISLVFSHLDPVVSEMAQVKGRVLVTWNVLA